MLPQEPFTSYGILLVAEFNQVPPQARAQGWLADSGIDLNRRTSPTPPSSFTPAGDEVVNVLLID